MIHICHKASVNITHRNRRHAATSAVCTLLILLLATAAARFIPTVQKSDSAEAFFTGIAFIPEKTPSTTKAAGSSLKTYIPTPELNTLPALPHAEAEPPEPLPELALIDHIESADSIFETDAEALLSIETPPTRKVSAPAKAAPAPRPENYIPPAYLTCPRPPYPSILRQRRAEGEVGLLIHINLTGNPTEVEITQSSGIAALDRIVINWILKNWRFSPARKNGQPVASAVKTSLVFSLNG